MDKIATEDQTIKRCVHRMDPAARNEEGLALLDDYLKTLTPGGRYEIGEKEPLRLRSTPPSCGSSGRIRFVGCPTGKDFQILRRRFDEVEKFCSFENASAF